MHLAHNAQNSIVHAYEDALSELLTKLDGVERYGFKPVEDVKRGLVVKIERELGELEKKVIPVLGVGEDEETDEETVGETMYEAGRESGCRGRSYG